VCYLSAQNILSSCLISRKQDENVQNCNFASCTEWVQTLVSHFEGGIYRVFENRVLRRIFEPKREEDIVEKTA
jgi:hypothetical protein